MAKVGCSLSFTFRVGPSDKNQFAKISFDLQEVDTSLPLEAQLLEAKKSLDVVWDLIKTKTDTEIEKTLKKRLVDV